MWPAADDVVDVAVLITILFALGSALQGDPAFDEGVRLYKQTEYEQAILQFQPLSTRPELAPKDRAEALVWLGLSQAGSGEVDAARATLRTGLELDRKLMLPTGTSPSIVKMFEELRTEVTAALGPAPEDTVVVVTPDPVPVVPEPEPEPAASPMMAIGIGGAVAGGVAIVVGGVLAVLAAGSLGTANDPEQFQDDAKAALDAANAEALGAGLLIPLGVALGAAGGAALVFAE